MSDERIHAFKILDKGAFTNYVDKILPIVQQLIVMENIYCLGENLHTIDSNRRVVPGGAGGAMGPPDFGRSANPISTDYARQIILAPPDFQTFLWP